MRAGQYHEVSMATRNATDGPDLQRGAAQDAAVPSRIPNPAYLAWDSRPWLDSVTRWMKSLDGAQTNATGAKVERALWRETSRLWAARPPAFIEVES